MLTEVKLSDESDEGPADVDGGCAAEFAKFDFANLRELDLRYNRIARSAGLRDLLGLGPAVEVRFEPQTVPSGVAIELGLSAAVESVPRDGGRLLREMIRERIDEVDDEDVDDMTSEADDSTKADIEEATRRIVMRLAKKDPLTPPISEIISLTDAHPTAAPSHRPHAKQHEVGGRLFDMIERALLDALRTKEGPPVQSLGDAFDDFELVVAVPELNSLYFQTADRLECFARHYLATRGRHFWSRALDGVQDEAQAKVLPHDAIFKVRFRRVRVRQAPRSAARESAQRRRNRCKAWLRLRRSRGSFCGTSFAQS